MRTVNNLHLTQNKEFLTIILMLTQMAMFRKAVLHDESVQLKNM
jgi:hypothetical protein